jgi:hypothetical protein
MNLQLRATETTDLERRLAKLEKLLARDKAKLDSHSGAPGSDLSHFREPPERA